MKPKIRFIGHVLVEVTDTDGNSNMLLSKRWICPSAYHIHDYDSIVRPLYGTHELHFSEEEPAMPGLVDLIISTINENGYAFNHNCVSYIRYKLVTI